LVISFGEGEGSERNVYMCLVGNPEGERSLSKYVYGRIILERSLWKICVWEDNIREIPLEDMCMGG
jgi:hypothetical protein